MKANQIDEDIYLQGMNKWNGGKLKQTEIRLYILNRFAIKYYTFLWNCENYQHRFIAPKTFILS